MLWYSLEAPRRGASNEFPQHMFSWRNKNDVMWIPPLICSYIGHSCLLDKGHQCPLDTFLVFEWYKTVPVFSIFAGAG